MTEEGLRSLGEGTVVVADGIAWSKTSASADTWRCLPEASTFSPGAHTYDWSDVRGSWFLAAAASHEILVDYAFDSIDRQLAKGPLDSRLRHRNGGAA
jgi:hypothetical protein